MDELLIHRIFRANSFLIEEGLELQKGEKFCSSEQLQRIDLFFKDRLNKPTFIEVKWEEVYFAVCK